MHEWKKGASGNLVIAAEEWMLSYKANAGEASGMGYGDGESAEETALLHRPRGAASRYFVLRGDHRRAFEQAIGGGWPALKEVYDRLKVEHISPYSEDYYRREGGK